MGMKQTEIGEIPEDWKIEKIDNLTSITTGAKNTQDKKSDGKYPFFVRSQKVERIDTYSFDGEGVLTAGDGVGTGKIFHYINGKFDFHQRVYLIYNFHKDLDGHFFFTYFSQNFYDRIMAMTAKSSVDSVRKEMISNMEIVLPPKQEQKNISTVLADTDNLIQATEQLINKKQLIKTSTMQNLLTGKIRLAEFDTKQTKPSELGEIPSDWDVVKLKEITQVKSGGTPSTNSSDFWNGNINWCTPTDITKLQGRKYLEKTQRTISQLGLQFSSAEVLPIGSIVMTSRATIGECAITTTLMTTNQGFKNFICHDEVYNEFLYYLLGTQKQRFINLCSGSTFLEISTTQVRNFSIVIPKSKKEQIAIANILMDK